MSDFVNVKIKSLNGQYATAGVPLSDDKLSRKLLPGEVVRVPKEHAERLVRVGCEITFDAPTRPVVFANGDARDNSKPIGFAPVRGQSVDEARASAAESVKAQLAEEAKAEKAKAEKAPQRRSE